LIESVVDRRVRPLEERLENASIQPVEAEEYLDIDELSRRIHTDVKTIRDWTYKKKIPFQKLPTGGVRFPWRAVKAWIDGQES
jgi:hypothetical protein